MTTVLEAAASGAVQDAGRRGRGRRIRAVHELHWLLAAMACIGDEQLGSEAAQVVAEATSRLNGLLAARPVTLAADRLSPGRRTGVVNQ